jgi:hypothetical protein
VVVFLFFAVFLLFLLVFYGYSIASGRTPAMLCFTLSRSAGYCGW